MILMRPISSGDKIPATKAEKQMQTIVSVHWLTADEKPFKEVLQQCYYMFPK